VDAASGVGQQQPRDGVEEEDWRTEHAEHDDDAAHDDGVDADARGEPCGDAAEPTGFAHDAEATKPAEEAGVGGGGSRRCRLGGRGVVLHDSIVAMMRQPVPWGTTLTAP
jgi:hypothetical protein